MSIYDETGIPYHTCIIHIYSIVPSSPPIIITISVLNSTAFNTTWRVPHEDEHNGLLEFVDARLIGKDLATSQMIIVPINNTDNTFLHSTILSPLEEYVNYSVSFAVRNDAGVSSYSNPVYLRTYQAGGFDSYAYNEHSVMFYSYFPL